VPFVQAAVNKPILGADFFSKHKLLVDTAGNRVLDAATLLPLGEPTGGKGTGLVAALSAVPPPVRSLPAWSATVPTHHALFTAFNTLWKQKAGPCSRKVGGWIRTNSEQRKRSSEPWKKQE
jgi:hypothetical protein